MDKRRSKRGPCEGLGVRWIESQDVSARITISIIAPRSLLFRILYSCPDVLHIISRCLGLFIHRSFYLHLVTPSFNTPLWLHSSQYTGIRLYTEATNVK